MCEESHIVKRAIIMAAGTGNRMHPLTLTTPKPLVKVNGVRMIDTVVDGLRSNRDHGDLRGRGASEGAVPRVGEGAAGRADHREPVLRYVQ